MPARLPLLVLLCTAQVVDVLDVNAVLVALPVIGADLGLRGGALQWVVTAYVLAFAGCLLPAGRLADLAGRRRVFAAGLALFTAASLACALAPGAEVLIAARAVQGLGAALTAPAALATLVAAFPAGPGRERAVAVWTGVAAAGGAAGLVLGGVIAGGPGWRWVFLINVPLGLAALALTPRLVPVHRPDGGARASLDLPGTLAATGGLALLVLALALAERSGPLAPGPLAALGGAALLLGGFVARERTAAAPLVAPALLRRRALVVALLAAAVLTATTSGGGVLATLHLQEALGLGPAAAGLTLLPLSLSVVTGSWAATRLRAGARTLIAGGLALVAAGSALAAPATGRGGLVAWAVLAGLGLGAASVAATTLGSSAVGDADRGVASGLLATAAQVGTALGVAGIVLVAGSAGHGAGFVAAAVAALLALGLPAVLGGRGQAPATCSQNAAAKRSAESTTGKWPDSSNHSIRTSPPASR
jgi:MFS family permease